MREILFKAKRLDNGEWVEGDLIHNIFGGMKRMWISSESYDKERLRSVHKYITEWRGIEIDPDTICQYTGLTDKNGRKIWENDILRRDGYWDIRIEFENGAFMVRNADKIQYINRVTYTFISTFDIKEYEVIGNIFDGGFNDGKKTKEN